MRKKDNPWRKFKLLPKIDNSTKDYLDYSIETRYKIKKLIKSGNYKKALK